MRLFIIIFFSVFIFSCSDSQNQKVAKRYNKTFKEPKKSKFTTFAIDSVADIKKGTNERSPAFIKQRLEQLIGNSYKKNCENAGITFPPEYVLFRLFKEEREFEIWAAQKPSDTLKLLAIIPVCAVDDEAGTKLRQGDGKTPEGFYTCKITYGSSNGFMWIKLNNKEIDDYGTVGYGSSFKMCIDYPLQIDQNRTRKTLGKTSPGSAICLHGNCVSAGCISFENKDFLPVFLSARYHHSKTYGYPKIHIYPFRFSERNKTDMSKKVSSEMSPEELVLFWTELEKAYNLFEKDRKAFKISFTNNTYNFSEFR
jgi:murein L,D-transpeptidase YafK